MTSDNALAGIGYMLAGVALFSLGDALGKSIVATYSVGQLLLLRAAVSLALLSPLIWRNRAAFLRIDRPLMHLARIALAVTEVAAFFTAAISLPLADVIAYYLACPIFVTALSAIILRERVGWRRWAAVAAGFAGVLIALQPSQQTLSWPALIALGGSLSFAGLMLTTRAQSATPNIVLTSTQFAGTLLVGAIIAPFAWTPVMGADLTLFVAAGVISIGALTCVTRSLAHAPASVVTPYQYTMIVWAIVLGYAVFGDVPTISTLIGAAIIVAAGLYIFMRERALAKGPTLPATPA